MGFNVSSLIGFGVAPDQVLRNSLVLNGSNQYVWKSGGITGTHQTIGTFAGWAKSNNPGNRRMMFSTGTSGGSPGAQHEWETGNNLVSYGYSSGWTVTATGILIPDTLWHHVVFSYDTNQAVAAQRCRVWIDGIENTTFGTANMGLGQFFQSPNDIHNWGFKQNGPGVYWNGKLADLYYINGQQLTPDRFISGAGAGQCRPIPYWGTLDAKCYRLSFDNADLVDSINGNNFTNQGGATFSTDVPGPYDPATVLLLHGDGANGSTTIIDSSPYARTMGVSGNAQISTAQSKFSGAALLFDGSGDAVWPNGSGGTDFAFGTADFTIEFFMRPTTNTATAGIYDGRPDAGVSLIPTIYTSAGILQFYTNGANRISGGQPAANVWSHVAVCRSGGNTKLFLDGVQQGSTYADSNNYTHGGTVRPFIGLMGDGGAGFAGYLDEIRVSKGIARYTANFTPPTAPFN